MGFSPQQFTYSEKGLKDSVANILKIFSRTKIKKLVVDHHLLRDLKWKERMKEVFAAAKERDIEIQTAAEFSGKENEMLEARRRELYKEISSAKYQ